MSDPLTGPDTGLPGVPTGSIAGTDAVGGPHASAAGGQAVACLFATRHRAEEARQELVNNGTPATAVHIASQEAGTAPAGDQANEAGGGMWDSIKRLFSGDDAEAYHEGVNRGHTLLTVQAQSADDADRLRAILQRYDPIDLDTQEASWRSEGWSGRPATATAPAHAMAAGAGEAGTLGEGKPGAPATATSTEDLAGRGHDEVIPVVEENLAVGKREAGGDEVRVRSHTVERPVEADVNLREERVQVEFRPVDRALGTDEKVFTERDIAMTESHEEPVVQKTARVVGEVVVSKDVTERTERVSDSVRKTEVEVDDDRPEARSGDPARH